MTRCSPSFAAFTYCTALSPQPSPPAMLRCALLILLTVLLVLLGGCGGSSDTQVAAPTLTAQPTASAPSTADGGAVTLSVGASGEGLAYQWQRNGVDLPGATAATLTLPALSLADDGARLRVQVSNPVGRVTSDEIVLRVTAVPPQLTAQPAAAAVNVGQTATFSAQARGSAPLTVQWLRNGSEIAGASQLSYTTPTLTLADNGATFTVRVRNAGGEMLSSAAALSVTPAPVPATITQAPQGVAVAPGATATFTVVAGGSPPFTYQWRRNGSDIAAATQASYTTPVLALADDGATFTVLVGNGAGNVVSAPALLSVRAVPVAPQITTQPQDLAVTAGQTATFSVAATGTAPLAFQWQRNGADLAGATAASYTTPATTLADGGARFAVRVGNAVGSVNSSVSTLSVSPAPVAPQITTAPQAVAAVVGQTATFTVTASGTPPLRYQWQRNGVDIAGANTSSHTTPTLTIVDSGALFSVRIGNAAGALVSAGAVLTVVAEPVSVLAGRAWSPVVRVAQEMGRDSTFVGLADDGRAVVVAEVRPLPPVVPPGRSNFVVMLGEPGSLGAARWTSPQTLASFGTRSGMAVPTDLRVDALRVAPSGRAVILASGSEGGCPRNAFGGIQTCRFVSVLDPAALTWSPWDVMALVSESQSSDFTLFGNSTLTLNDRGDLALSFAALPGEPVARVFWRTGGEVVFRSMLMRATPTEPARRGKVTLDEAGGLVFAAELLQGGTTDIAVWRGSVAAGLSGPVVVDTRAAPTTLRALHTGRSGRSYLFWEQNNGVANSLYAVRFQSVSTVLAAEDLGPTLAQAFPPNNQLLEASVRDDDVMIASRGGLPNNNCSTARWPFSGSLVLIDAPAPCLGSVSAVLPLQFGRERGGNRLVMRNDWTWTTYDADLNRQIHAAIDASTVSSGPGYVTGVRSAAIDSALVQLSRSGIGLAVFVANFDIWPTPSMPNGDGRPGVRNLWVTYFK